MPRIAAGLQDLEGWKFRHFPTYMKRILHFKNITFKSSYNWCLLVLGQANSSNRRKEPSWFAVLYSSWRSIKTDIRIGIVMRKLFTWELSVRVCQDEWVRVCVLRQKRGEELLLWDDQGLPIGHPGLALSEREPGEPAEPDNVIIRAGLQRNKPYLVWSRTR